MHYENISNIIFMQGIKLFLLLILITTLFNLSIKITLHINDSDSIGLL